VIFDGCRVTADEVFDELLHDRGDRPRVALEGGLSPADDAVIRLDPDEQPPRWHLEGLDAGDTPVGHDDTQPFVAPAVSPETMYFCANRAITMIGSVMITAAAMMAPQSTLA